MKKLFYILLFFAVPLFAQNTDQSGKILTTQQIQREGFERTVQAHRVRDIGSLNFYSFSDTTNTSYDSLAFGFASRRIILINRASSSDTLFYTFSITPGATDVGFILGGDAPFTLLQQRAYIKIKGNLTGKNYQIISE